MAQDITLFDIDGTMLPPGTTKERWYRAVRATRDAGVLVRLNVDDAARCIWCGRKVDRLASRPQCGCEPEPTGPCAWFRDTRYRNERTALWTADGEPTEASTTWWNHGNGGAGPLVDAFRAEGFHVVWDGTDAMSVGVDDPGVVSDDPTDLEVVKRILHEEHDARVARLDSAGAPIAARFQTDGAEVDFEFWSRDIPSLRRAFSTRGPEWLDTAYSSYEGSAYSRMKRLKNLFGDLIDGAIWELAVEAARVATPEQVRTMRCRLKDPARPGYASWHHALDDGLLARAQENAAA